MRTLLCCAVAVILVGCGSSTKTGAPAGSSAAPSGSTATTAAATPDGSGATTATTAGGSGGDPKPTGAFCADVRNGAVASAMSDAVNPTGSASSLDQLKKIDGEAPSEIKSDTDTMVKLLTQIHDAGTDAARQAVLASGGPQLQAAGARIGTYITAHCA